MKGIKAVLEKLNDYNNYNNKSFLKLEDGELVLYADTDYCSFNIVIPDGDGWVKEVNAEIDKRVKREIKRNVGGYIIVCQFGDDVGSCKYDILVSEYRGLDDAEENGRSTPSDWYDVIKVWYENETMTIKKIVLNYGFGAKTEISYDGFGAFDFDQYFKSSNQGTIPMRLHESIGRITRMKNVLDSKDVLHDKIVDYIEALNEKQKQPY